MKNLTPIFGILAFAGTALAGALDDKSVVVLVRDGGNFYAEEHEMVANAAMENLETTGLQVLRLENFTPETMLAGTQKISPADAADLSGADLILVVQLAAPKNTELSGVKYSRSLAAYNLFSADGKAILAGTGSAVREGGISAIVPATENAMADLVAKIKSGKVKFVAEKSVVPARIICQVESIALPKIALDENGVLTIFENEVAPNLAGTEIIVAGTTYNLDEKNEVVIDVPANRAIALEAKGGKIKPIKRFAKVQNGKIVLSFELNEAARARLQADVEKLNALKAAAIADGHSREVELENRQIARDARERQNKIDDENRQIAREQLALKNKNEQEDRAFARERENADRVLAQEQNARRHEIDLKLADAQIKRAEAESAQAEAERVRARALELKLSEAEMLWVKKMIDSWK